MCFVNVRFCGSSGSFVGSVVKSATFLALGIIQYTEENCCNPNLSLDHIAAAFNTNPSYVSSVVSATLKIGFHEYLTNLRIAEAKRLLAQTSKNVQEIYTQCGFQSQQTFYRTFKNSTDMTPNSYRKLTNKK